MGPLKATFQKMTRLVRDVALKSGKPVEFETEGEDTEIDRNMVDIIGGPLIHMIRNAIDHGIEKLADRVAKGKRQEGTVRLAAYHAGGYVVVELQDDGKGLDRDKILQKAIEKGLIESDKGMSNGEVFNLIFAPGFSTADQVSDLSGRGVGMDVVKRNIESLRGRIHISSEAGRGSLFMMRLPLTLAITDGMLVRIGTGKYIISTVNIYLSFQPLGAKKERLIVKVAGGACVNKTEDEDHFQIGKRNFLMLRKLLWKNGVMIKTEDVGGQNARTMSLSLADGEIIIRSNGTEHKL